VSDEEEYPGSPGCGREKGAIKLIISPIKFEYLNKLWKIWNECVKSKEA
jgi:hypothetical protein